MESTSNGVNVEQIMEEIRQEIRDKGYRDDTLSFEDIPCPQDNHENPGPFDRHFYNESLDTLNHGYTVVGCRPLAARNKLFLFLKKLVRKLAIFYVEPIVHDQNEFNLSVVRVSNSVRNYINDQTEMVDTLAQRVKKLETQLAETQQKLAKLEQAAGRNQ